MSETKVPTGSPVGAFPPPPPLHETVVVAEPSQAAGAGTLRRNALSMPEVLAQSVANAAPTAAMALLPLLVFLNAGNGTWLSFVAAVITMVCVGYCAAQFASRMNSAGGFYVWVTKGFGPAAGHASGWGLLLGYIATGMATTLGFAIFGGDFLNRVMGVKADSIWLVVILLAIDTVLPIAVAIADMGLSARTSLTLESISIVIILVLCVAIWIAHGPVDGNQLTFSGVKGGGILVGVTLAIFAFVGFESAGALGMEAKNPQKNIGRAIIFSALIVGVFYLIVSYSQVLGFQGTDQFAKSSAPMPDLAGKVGVGFLAPIIDIGIICSMFACTLACINASARMLLTISHDGMGHSVMTRVSASRKTPHIGIWVAGLPMFIVPAAFILVGRSAVDVTGWSGTVATFGFMLGYGLVSAAAPYYLYKMGESKPLVWLAGIVGAVSMVIVFYASWLPTTIPLIGQYFSPLTSPYDKLPYVFFAWAAIGILWFAIVRTSRPEVGKSVGSRYESHEPASV
ncbi:MAG TPA: APC family permease [Candidatus Dormibacteraeota bacterium]|jgi:amino acid transporter